MWQMQSAMSSLPISRTAMVPLSYYLESKGYQPLTVDSQIVKREELTCSSTEAVPLVGPVVA
eukprot:2036219-Rhodomonas_salina.1